MSGAISASIATPVLNMLPARRGQHPTIAGTRFRSRRSRGEAALYRPRLRSRRAKTTCKGRAGTKLLTSADRKGRIVHAMGSRLGGVSGLCGRRMPEALTIILVVGVTDALAQLTSGADRAQLPRSR